MERANQNKTPVVFATDSAYLAPVYLAAHSLLRCRRGEDKLKIFILCPQKPEERIALLFDRLSNLGGDVHFCPVGDRADHLQLNPNLPHISVATFFRFYIPEELTSYDRCLYMDADIVVCGDLSEVLNSEMGNNLICGVKEYHTNLKDPEVYEKRCRECSLPAMESYVNAGVLLMNLRAMRQNGICQKMLADCAEHTYQYNDQDVLNRFCYPHIGFLPLKYNFLVPYLRYAREAGEKIGEDVNSVRKEAVVLHYASKRKPWLYRSTDMADEWWKELKKLPRDARSTLVEPFIRQKRANLSLRSRLADDKNALINRLRVK